MKVVRQAFFIKNFKSFFNDQKASKEAIRPKMFIKNFLKIF